MSRMSAVISPRDVAGRRCRAPWAACFLALLVLVGSATPSSASAEPRTIRVGVYENEPKVYTTSAGEPAGIFVDIIEAIAEKESWSVEFVPVTWEQGLDDLEAGRIDLMPDVAYSEARAARFDFHSTPVMESWSYVYSAHDEHIDRISQLDGKRVAVLEGSIQETVFAQMVRGFGYSVEIVPVASLTEAFEAAAEGKVDAAIANHAFGDAFYHDYGLTKTPIVFNPVPLFFATTQGHNADLLRAIDRHLSTWIAEPGSIYYRTLEKHVYDTGEPVVPLYLLWALGGAAAALLAAFGIIALLRWQVRLRTADLVEANTELEDAYGTTLAGWSRALDLRDRETQGHTSRVTELAVALAKRMGTPEEELAQMRQGGLLHDIGKLSVPDAVLLKPGLLDDDEWEVMRRHPQHAYDMLSSVEYLLPALDIPYCHHEKWDGSGYPQGLAGEDIPRAARIFAIADVWDALLSNRPYRPAWTEAEARAYVETQSGKQFDPEVVQAFIDMIAENTGA